MRWVSRAIIGVTFLVFLIGCESKAQKAEKQQRILAEAQLKAKQVKEEAKRKEEELTAKMIGETLGDEIICHAHTVGIDDFRNSFNESILKPRAFINKTNGILTIMFDFDPEVTKELVIYHFLVRLFDANGQHLKHFTTKEYFTHSEKYRDSWDRNGNVILLKAKGNDLQYQINLRDANFVSACEFGIQFR